MLTSFRIPFAFLVSVCAWLQQTPCLARQSEHTVHSQARNLIAPIIDGAKNPERIPDQTAIKVFLIAVAEPPNATSEQLKRLRAKIQLAKLNDADIAVFIAEVAAFHSQWQAYQSQADKIGHLNRSNPNPSLRRGLTNIHVQISNLANATFQSILKHVSPEGAQNLLAHLAYVKTKIKVIPPPKM
jgi:hypothetical protein